MPQPPPAAPTIGAIAKRYRVPLHRVEYVIRARGIRPASLAGNVRVFSEDDVDRIGNELRRIQSDRVLDAATHNPNQECEPSG